MEFLLPWQLLVDLADIPVDLVEVMVAVDLVVEALVIKEDSVEEALGAKEDLEVESSEEREVLEEKA